MCYFCIIQEYILEILKNLHRNLTPCSPRTLLLPLWSLFIHKNLNQKIHKALSYSQLLEKKKVVRALQPLLSRVFTIWSWVQYVNCIHFGVSICQTGTHSTNTTFSVRQALFMSRRKTTIYLVFSIYWFIHSTQQCLRQGSHSCLYFTDEKNDFQRDWGAVHGYTATLWHRWIQF